MGDFETFKDFIKLTQYFNCIHVAGGYPVEPVDIHASVRHLDCLYEKLTLTDKVVHAYSLGAERVVYVPGHTAHRTVNTGAEPLVYWGVLSSRAGHDYGALAENNFALVVVEIEGRPQVLTREGYLRSLRSAPNAGLA